MESGSPIFESEVHAANFEKRARKLQNALKDYEAWKMYEQFGTPGAPVAIVGWGSTIGPVREAVARAQAEDMPVEVLYPKLLFPLPREHIGDFIRDRQVVIIPELNFTGQFARTLQAEFGREFVRLNKYGGVPFATREIYEKIKTVYAGLNEKVKA